MFRQTLALIKHLSNFLPDSLKPLLNTGVHGWWTFVSGSNYLFSSLRIGKNRRWRGAGVKRWAGTGSENFSWECILYAHAGITKTTITTKIMVLVTAAAATKTS